MAAPITAVIVGGGLGGLTAARCLQRAGARVKLFEALPSWEDRLMRDRGLGMWREAQRVLAYIGLRRRFEEIALKIPPASYRSKEGTWLLQAQRDETGEKVLSCRQSDLLTLLRDDSLHPSLPPLEISFGKRVISCEGQGEAGYEVDPKMQIEFSDGTMTEGDFVVGADGVSSLVRQATAPGTRRGFLYYTGFRSFGGIIEDMEGAGEEPYETVSDENRFAVIPLRYKAGGSGGKSIEGKRKALFWFATLRDDAADGFLGPGRAMQEWGPPTDAPVLESLHSTFGSFHDPIPKILEETERRQLPLLMDHHMQDKRVLFNIGRVAFVGDAAHAFPPNLAQAGSVAIEDAWELSVALTPYLRGLIPRIPAKTRLETKFKKKIREPTSITNLVDIYGTRRTQRVTGHHTVTDAVAQLTGLSDSLRSGILSVTPLSWKQQLFDYFLQKSFGGPKCRVSIPPEGMQAVRIAAEEEEEAKRQIQAQGVRPHRPS
uniref:FAD-binding domain-containing protein n=1 Tax=Chromera velia CCMP2878 TaxID=1169474 RepID=A0A0G4FEQ9_9ALVE|eukprot:Cvel_16635.t1-p1 / transcript=Cvel_16635.t1 / gene=Cvel_16635 / organism=Chromera_velia_CCMP2878 / gene_product=6-hydroxynicotinate 3-monooxygenase, putative / transcript_product=6-hydroxynicotinate 3-monooxygenase, putative / location=Cvel_scaffold1290:1442-3595(-) / protein_length=487 / sequence_SO=supercontig / SO=protein_coding / is_pseudo=false